MADILGEIVALLVEWIGMRLPRGCLIAGCAASLLFIGVVLLILLWTAHA